MSDLGARLGAWLSEQRGTTLEVQGLEAVSAGARRFNALFSLVDPATGHREDLALTMIPTVAIQILDVAAEAAVRTAAEQAGVPVPHVHHVCTDESVLGGPFFVSTAVPGETVPRRVLRLVQGADPAQRLGETVVTGIGTALARLHTIPVAEAPEALPRPDGAGPVDMAIRSLDEELSLGIAPSPVFSYGVRWLERNAPSEPARQTIVHSDVRNGNVIVGPDGLRAILDWEGSRIGDPMRDLSWPCMRMWRFREDALTVAGMAGLPTLVEAYRAAGGDWDPDRFRWWRVFGTVSWGLGLAGQARGHLDGSFRSIVMAASGRRVAELEYDVLLLLRSAS